MLFFLTFFVLAIIGGTIAAYLVYKRKKAEAPICPLRGDCAAVLQSKYNKIFGVHTDIIGLIYYIGAALSPLPLALYFLLPLPDFLLGPKAFTIILLGSWVSVMVATFLAFLMTLRLLYIQFFIIKKMCFWCLLSSLCVIGMTIALFAPLVWLFGFMAINGPITIDN